MVGEGSNIIPKKCEGISCENDPNGISQLEDGDDTVLVEVSAGENWNDFVFAWKGMVWFGKLGEDPGLCWSCPNSKHWCLWS